MCCILFIRLNAGCKPIFIIMKPIQTNQDVRFFTVEQYRNVVSMLFIVGKDRSKLTFHEKINLRHNVQHSAMPRFDLQLSHYK